MNTISFNIEHWHALSPGLTTPEEWQHYTDHAFDNEKPSLEVNLIPAMMRRRMSPLSKVALQTAIHLQQSTTSEFDYLIFSSRHGELPRTVELLQQVLQGEEASPMAFSQSVHNTSAGLFTIATKSPIPATSLAGCESSLHHALIEASAYLAENPQHKILLIDFDAPLPKPYDQFDATPTPPLYALGLVLGSGSQTQINWQTKKPSSFESKNRSQTIDIIQQLAHQSRHWTIEDSRNQWQWQRGDAE
ncbi:beta-ketoacyl synthase chain length factor [Vibrio sp. CK2-1]|uniref:beta-ketoacyl synthase chain length factor n=1 Tax=Vibrio sp. CK2-1 TaxID=2912249 RepID=UPI001F3B1151|nr:beta-ketoacyl synthase chain length factor [Vibrio sp. CK2-1]MCF7353757.1 beta-ketoacyl synthase chain length factor [Vibrio sp. CK2-1]